MVKVHVMFYELDRQLKRSNFELRQPNWVSVGGNRWPLVQSSETRILTAGTSERNNRTSGQWSTTPM